MAEQGVLGLAQTAGPDVIYVGMGETGFTPYNTHGDGAIEVHPANPDIVYVAAFGRRFGNNPERGVYRSIGGDARRDLVCHVAANAGAVDIALDSGDPLIIYA